MFLALLGFFGITGPTAADSLFGESWFFDNGENWGLAIMGVVSLVIAFSVPEMTKKWIVVAFGAIAVLLGVYSFFTPNLLGSQLQNPTDTILYLILGVWGLLAAFMGTTPKQKEA